MLKRCGYIILLIGLPLFCLPQNGKPFDSTENKSLDSLEQQLRMAKDDSTLIIAFQRIGFFYEHLNIDSSLKYYNTGLRLARQRSFAWAEARLLASLSGVMEHQGKFAEEFDLLFQSLKIAEESKSGYDIARANRRISGVYFELENYPKTIVYILKALQIDEVNHLEDKAAIDHYALADAYEKTNKLDSATFHINIALRLKDYLKGLMQYVYDIDGNIKRKKGNNAQAFLSYNEGFKEAQKSSDLIGSSQICADISSLYVQLSVRDSAIFYALEGYNYGKGVSFKKGIMRNCNLLAELYDSTRPSLALQYYKIADAAKDSLFGVNNIQTIQNLISREEAKQRKLEEAEAAYKEKIRLYGLLSGLSALLIIAFMLFRNNRHKQKANVLLRQQKQKVESTLSELKSTQAQLIQSEKMASLGELTAGIAHEIQNPLNFVNNFSEVNTELVDELKNELATGNMQSATEIANSIKANEQKINHHGRRADAIVKGMLQHSRTSGGQKEQTDVNAICDEYLRLAYHGLRVKDKNFNAEIQTDFDVSVGKINIVSHEIGRVILNLINNAFYAVNEKTKLRVMNYEPIVTISTKKIVRGIEISVKDNGSGIPDSIKDKIFQPFFTTKPTGQGTGLGLSLAYDIVKAHGGEIKVETKDGEGSEFIIQLPIHLS
jgi:two-component system NtrC family sensor kinase